ncbi:ComEC/Rec2 family competence protein [Ruminococcus sp.]|uniref:ComEC/Rec2 family competence protein n=1 Tax=Ruminococcus sp. TaxID=41978 RepID=UPI0025DE738C|nr:ComEC/Rec2 family competence protein [Ruminococcus sp.]
MAGRKKKKKGSGGLAVGQLRKAVGLIAGFVILLFWLLDMTGIISFDSLLIKAGVEDKPAEHAQTEVHFVDVGQGDSTLVISQGEAMLIDSGDKDDNNTIEKYLEKQGVTEIKYLIATHPHADHIGEMSEIIDQFDVDKFIMPKVPKEQTPTTAVYEKMLKSAKKKGLKITPAKAMEFELGSCKVELFTPSGTYDNLNDYSTLVKITDGDNSFLITGDCETPEEKDILKQGYDISAKVLKAGHHGSSTSSSADFLNVVMPRYAVISCAKENKYGHPHEETVTRLKKYASHLYITADNGTVVFRSDGEGLSVSVEKGEK